MHDETLDPVCDGDQALCRSAEAHRCDLGRQNKSSGTDGELVDERLDVEEAHDALAGAGLIWHTTDNADVQEHEIEDKLGNYNQEATPEYLGQRESRS